MKLLLDACVLYPTVIRNLLLNVSDELRWDINWSARILEEWRRASAKTNLEAEAQAEAEITMLKVKYPKASVNNFERHISKLYLPDQNDLHVLAAAIEINENIDMKDKNTIIILPSFAERYLSTDLFNDI